MDGVGAVDAGVGEDSVGVGHGTDTSIDQGGVSLPLPAARHNGSEVVGADANVGGVGDAEGSVGNGVGSSGVGDGVGSDSVGVARVGVGVASVGNVGGSDGSDGSVGDHADVVGPSILDRLGDVSSCGNLANSPGLGLSLSLPLAVVGVGVAVGVGVRHGSNLGVGEPSNLHSAVVGGGGEHSSICLTSQNLADGVRVGLTSDSSHQGNNNEGFHIEASLADCPHVLCPC